MKQKKERLTVEIINEPGDGTHYHYHMTEGRDAFYFSGVNELNYPKKISKNHLMGINAEKISVKYMREFLYTDMQKGKRERDVLHEIGKNQGGANIWTVAECIRSAMEELCEKN